MNDSLEQRVERFLRTGTGEFDSLALEVFTHQYAKNPPYRAFCNALGIQPGNVTRWQDIPAVPLAAFKSSELTTGRVESAAAVFHSSGTTQKTPSRHVLKSLSYYEASLMAGFERWVLPERTKQTLLILTPSPAETPRSSLSWMMDVVKRRWGADGSAYFIQRGIVQDWPLFKALSQAQAENRPVILLGTTLAFLSLFDLCAKQKKTFRCAPGSRLMDTGGMKTREREVTREDFLGQVQTYLGIPENESINEYGMCELSSQFYGRGASTVLSGPPWVRTLVIDLQSGQPVEGKPGVLRHFDLANFDSVLAIQTEDLGVSTPEGFSLKGRAPAAEIKGCSIDLEAYLQRA